MLLSTLPKSQGFSLGVLYVCVRLKCIYDLSLFLLSENKWEKQYEASVLQNIFKV